MEKSTRKRTLTYEAKDDLQIPTTGLVQVLNTNATRLPSNFIIYSCAAFAESLSGTSNGQAVNLTAEIHEIKKNNLYKWALSINNKI